MVQVFMFKNNNMKKYKMYMIKLIGGLAIITIISILMVVLSDVNRTIIAYTDMTGVILFTAVMLNHGFKNGIIKWR